MSRWLRNASASSRVFGLSLCRPSASASTAPCQSKPACAGCGCTAAPRSKRPSVTRRSLMPRSMSRGWRICRCLRRRFRRRLRRRFGLAQDPDGPLDLLAQPIWQVERPHVLVFGERLLAMTELPVEHGEIAAWDPRLRRERLALLECREGPAVVAELHAHDAEHLPGDRIAVDRGDRRFEMQLRVFDLAPGRERLAILAMRDVLARRIGRVGDGLLVVAARVVMVARFLG